MASKTKTIIKNDFKPTAGYMLIEPIEAKKQTDSGIYLPDSSEEKPIKGKVIAVGSDEITDSGIKKKSPAKVGDYIIYKKWGGSEVNIAGKEYLFAKFEDVLAIVKK